MRKIDFLVKSLTNSSVSPSWRFIAGMFDILNEVMASDEECMGKDKDSPGF